MLKFRTSRDKCRKVESEPTQKRGRDKSVGARGVSASYGKFKLHLDRDVVLTFLDLLTRAWFVLWRGVTSVVFAITLVFVVLAVCILVDPTLGGILPVSPVEQGSDPGE